MILRSGILFFLLIWGSVATAEEICIGLSMARRKGSEKCWVEFPIAPYQKLCIDRQAWRYWLEEPMGNSICGNWPGRWKEYSPPVNDERDGPKKRYLRFLASGFPASQPHSSILFSSWKRMENLREEISNLIAPYDAIGICRQLLLNEAVPNSPAGLLRTLGFIHLITASGIHLYSLSNLVQTLFMRVGAFLRIPMMKLLLLSRVCVVLTWFSAWLLNGLRPGMLRPWIVVSLRFIAQGLGFRWHPWAPLVTALSSDFVIAAIHFCCHASGAWAPGRWHYALAVGGGLFALEQSQKSHPRRSIIREHYCLAMGSWLLIALWDASSFDIIALATPVLSMITLPLFTIILYPGIWLTLALFGMGFHSMATFLAQRIGIVITKSVLSLFSISLSVPTLWVVPHWAVYLGVFLSLFILVCQIGAQAKVFILFCLLLGRGSFSLLPDVDISHYAEKIEQLDVGQGDSALVFSPKRWFSSPQGGLVDSASFYALSDDQWIHLLASREMRRLNWIVLTHLDEDHSGGVIRLARILPIDCIITSREELETERGMRWREALGKYGVHVSDWRSHCFPFPFLPPSRVRVNKKSGNQNMSAVWIPIQRNGFYLSAGDAGIQDELRVGDWVQKLTLGRGYLNQRILKISHHGSRFSTSIDFLKELQPTQAWISVGIGNRYGHPTSTVIDQLIGLKIPIQRTDLQGFISSEK